MICPTCNAELVKPTNSPSYYCCPNSLIHYFHFFDSNQNISSFCYHIPSFKNAWLFSFFKEKESNIYYHKNGDGKRSEEIYIPIPFISTPQELSQEQINLIKFYL